MSPESSGSMGLDDANWPDDDDWPEDDSDDDDWPVDDEADDQPGTPWPAGPPGPAPDQPGTPWPAGPPGPAPRWAGGPPRSRVRPLALAAVAVVALGAGAGVAVVVARGLSSSPPAAQSPGNVQPSTVPGGNGGGVPPGSGDFPGNGGAVGQLILGGKVVAVSATSITIAGGSHPVTAAVTSSTRVTGNVTSIGAVKVGDLVMAELTESGGKATATMIQDPASLPSSGGGLPPVGGSGP
jgi:hypothetical protein